MKSSFGIELSQFKITFRIISYLESLLYHPFKYPFIDVLLG